MNLQKDVFIMVSATKTVLASGMLVLGSSMSALPQEAATKTLYFEDEICLNVDLTAPEIVDVRTARRLSLNAAHGLFLEATSFDLAALPHQNMITLIQLPNILPVVALSMKPEAFKNKLIQRDVASSAMRASITHSRGSKRM